MTYSSLPNSGQSLGQTRAAIKNNFDLIKTTLDQNHVDLDLANKGKHYVIQMPVTASIPVAPLPPGGLVAGESNLYSKTSSAASQIFFSPDASGNEYQLTRAITASFPSFSTNAAYGVAPPNTVLRGGWTFLPGGMLFQYGVFRGTGTSNTPSSGTIPFPVQFTTACFSIQLQVRRNDAAGARAAISRTSPPTTSDFTYDLESGTCDGVYWTAIGV
jgi:hypothetical protein